MNWFPLEDGSLSNYLLIALSDSPSNRMECRPLLYFDLLVVKCRSFVHSVRRSLFLLRDVTVFTFLQMFINLPTTLELFSNELFLDVFEYFNDVDLLRAFTDLNTCLNCLLFDSSRTLRVDLCSISRDDFYGRDLPAIQARLISFRMSDDDERPYQCVCFLSDGVTLGQFDHLRSLRWTISVSIRGSLKIIAKSFFPLKVLQLKMDFSLPSTTIDENHRERFERYFTTYGSSF